MFLYGTIVEDVMGQWKWMRGSKVEITCHMTLGYDEGVRELILFIYSRLFLSREMSIFVDRINRQKA